MKIDSNGKRFKIVFTIEELPEDYNRAYTLDFLLREKLGESDRKTAIEDLQTVLGVSSRMIQMYRSYKAGNRGGKLSKRKIEIIANYFGIDDALLYAPRRMAA